jgi:nucleoside-diphosphate-sugar epimerase
MTSVPPHLFGTPARRRIVAEDVDAILARPLPWERLADASVLVSGANGFLAAYMVETLLGMRERLGFGPARILGLVRSEARAQARFAQHLDRRELIFVEASVEDALAIGGPLPFIVHAASNASPRFYLTDPVGVMRANLDGTRNLLDLARDKGSRFLFFSSGEVYGQTDRVPTREGDYGHVEPTAVRSCYAESKRAGETMCVCWAHQYGLHASIVRPFHTYGPGVALDDGRVFADFVADVAAGRDIVMKSDGSARRAFCYIADATAGFFTVLLRGESGTAYNIGNEQAEVSIRSLAETLVSLFPDKQLKVIMNAQAHPPSYAASPIARNAPDVSRARAIGWEPATSIEEGFRRMVLSYE